MRAGFFLLSITALLCGTECFHVEELRFGRVEISAFSTLGEKGTEKDYSDAFHGGTAEAVPYGRYLLRLYAPGFGSSTERELRVFQPKLSVRTQFALGIGCPELSEVSGAVRPGPGDRELWAKLVPVYGPGGEDARISHNGFFLISGLDAGDYVLLIMDAGTVLDTENLRVRGSLRNHGRPREKRGW